MYQSSFLQVLPQILAVSVKNIILIGFGMTLGFSTILISSLQKHEDQQSSDLSLTKEQISWISSLNLISVPLGCVFSGSFATLIGRRRSMQLVNVPIFISWIIFFYAQHVYQLYIALVISGFAGGMLEAPVLTYVAEITVPKIRGLLAATGSTCIILGIFSQFVMITFLNWRMITLVSSAVPILTIVLLFFVPESPHWLIIKHRDEEAKTSLMWLRGWQVSYDNVRKEFEELHENLSKSRSGKSSFSDNFKEFGKRTFLFPYAICSLSFFIGHFSGMTTLQTYPVIIFTELKAPIDKRLATSFLGGLEFIGTLICVIFVKLVGKRRLAFVSTIGCGICFLSTAIYSIVIKNIIEIPRDDNSSSFNFTEKGHYEVSDVSIYNETGSGLRQSGDEIGHQNNFYWIPLTLLLASALLSHCGIRLLPWMLVGEIYPTKIRGIASGLSGGTGYIFGFLANKLFLSMVTLFTMSGTFVIYSSISFVGCTILYFFMPGISGGRNKTIYLPEYFVREYSFNRTGAEHHCGNYGLNLFNFENLTELQSVFAILRQTRGLYAIFPRSTLATFFNIHIDGKNNQLANTTGWYSTLGPINIELPWVATQPDGGLPNRSPEYCMAISNHFIDPATGINSIFIWNPFKIGIADIDCNLETNFLCQKIE